MAGWATMKTIANNSHQRIESPNAMKMYKPNVSCLNQNRRKGGELLRSGKARSENGEGIIIRERYRKKKCLGISLGLRKKIRRYRICGGREAGVVHIIINEVIARRMSPSGFKSGK